MARHTTDLKYREERLRQTVHRLVAVISNIGNNRGTEGLNKAIDAALNEAHYGLLNLQRGLPTNWTGTEP